MKLHFFKYCRTVKTLLLFVLLFLCNSSKAAECAVCDNIANTEVYIESGCSLPLTEVQKQLPKVKLEGGVVPTNTRVFFCEGVAFNDMNRELAESKNFEAGKTYTIRTEIYPEGELQLDNNMLCSCDQTFRVWKVTECPAVVPALFLHTPVATNTEIRSGLLGKDYFAKDASSCICLPTLVLVGDYAYTHAQTHDGCDNKPKAVSYQLLTPNGKVMATCQATVVVVHPSASCPTETLRLVVDDENKTDVTKADLPALVKSGAYYSDPCGYGVSAPEISIATASHYNRTNTHTNTALNDCEHEVENPQTFTYNILDAEGGVSATCPATIVVTKGDCQSETCGRFVSYTITSDISTPGTNAELFPVLEGVTYGPKLDKTTEFVGRYEQMPITEDNTGMHLSGTKTTDGLNDRYQIGTTYVVWKYTADAKTNYCYQRVTVKNICDEITAEDYGIVVTPDEGCYYKATEFRFVSTKTPQPDVTIFRQKVAKDWALGKPYTETLYADNIVRYNIKDNRTGCEYRNQEFKVKVVVPEIDCETSSALFKEEGDGVISVPLPLKVNSNCVGQYGWVYKVTDKDGNPIAVEGLTKDEDEGVLRGKFPSGYFKIAYTLNINQSYHPSCTKEYFLVPELEPCVTSVGEPVKYQDLVGSDLSGWNLSYGTQDRYGDYYFNADDARANYYQGLWGRQRLHSAETGIDVGILRRQVAFGSHISVQDWGRILDTKFLTNAKPLNEYLWADKWNRYYGSVAGSGTLFAPAYNSTTALEQVDNVYLISYKTSKLTFMKYTCASSNTPMPVTAGANPVVFGPRFSAADANAAHFYLHSDTAALDPLFGDQYAHTTSSPLYQLLKVIPSGFASSIRVGASSVPFHNSGYLPKAGGAEFYGLNNFDLASGACSAVNNAIADNNAGLVKYKYTECENGKISDKTAALNLSLAPAANSVADRAQKTFIVDAALPYLLVNYASVLGVDVSDFPLHKGNYCSSNVDESNATISHVGKEANFSILVEVKVGDDWITLPQSIINSAPVTQVGTGNNNLSNLNRNYESGYFHQATFKLDDGCSASATGLGFSQTTAGTDYLTNGYMGELDQHNEAFVTTGWRSIGVDLRDYIGKQVRLTVQNADCNDFAGHSCYHPAYTYFSARRFDFELQYCPKSERIDVKVSKGFGKYAFRLISGNDTTPMVAAKGSVFAFTNIFGHENGNPRIQIFGDDNLLLDTLVMSTAPEALIAYEPETYTSTLKTVRLTDATIFSKKSAVSQRTWRVYSPSPSLTKDKAPSADNKNYIEYSEKQFSTQINKLGQWVYLFVTNTSCCSDTDSVFIDVSNYEPSLKCNDVGRAIPATDIAKGGVTLENVFVLNNDACVEEPVFTFDARDADNNPIANMSTDLARSAIKGDFKDGYSTVTITATMCGATTSCTSKLYLTPSYSPCYSTQDLQLFSFDVVGNSFKDWTLSYGSQDRYFRFYSNAHEARKGYAEVCKGPANTNGRYQLAVRNNWISGTSYVVWAKPWDQYYGVISGETISTPGWSPAVDFKTEEATLDYVYNVDPETNGGTEEAYDHELKVTYHNPDFHPTISNFKIEGEINNYRFYIYTSNPGYDPLFGDKYKHTMKDDRYQLLPIMPSAGYPVIRVGSSTVPYHNEMVGNSLNYLQRGGCSEWTYKCYSSSAGSAICENRYPKYRQVNTQTFGKLTYYDDVNNDYVSPTNRKNNVENFFGLAPAGHANAERAQHTFLIDDDNKNFALRYAPVISCDITHVGCHYNERESGLCKFGGRGPNTSVILEVKHNGQWMRLPGSLLHMRAKEFFPYPNNNDDARNIYFRREMFAYEGKGVVGQEDNISVTSVNHPSNFNLFHQANFAVDNDEGCNPVMGLGYNELNRTVVPSSTDGVNAANFSQENHNECYITTGWQPLKFDLRAYVGDSARLTIEAADCCDRQGDPKEHGAYIYVTSLPTQARITYCKSTRMVNGAAERGYSNYYVRFATATDSTPLIRLGSNFFALQNPYEEDEVRIQIYGDDFLMYEDTLDMFVQAQFEEKQKCYNVFDFNKVGDNIDGTTYKYIIFDADAALTATKKPTAANTRQEFEGDTLTDVTIDAKGQWVYFVSTKGECCTDTAKKFILPVVKLDVACGDKRNLGTLNVDTCFISLQQVLDIYDNYGSQRPHNLNADCESAYQIGYRTENNNNYQFVDADADLTAIKFGYNTKFDYIVKWRFYGPNGTDYTDCNDVIKFKVDYPCPLYTSANSNNVGALALTGCGANATVGDVVMLVKEKLQGTPYDHFNSCGYVADTAIFLKLNGEPAYHEEDASFEIEKKNTDHSMRWAITFTNGSVKNCDYTFKYNTALTCVSKTVTFNVTDDKCDYTAAEGLVALKEVGSVFPADEGCISYLISNKDVNAANAAFLWNYDGNRKLGQGDNHIGWKKTLTDGSEFYCNNNVKINFPCPGVTKTLTVTSDKCDYSLGEVVEMLKNDGKNIPAWDACTRMVYSPVAISAANEARFVDADENTEIRIGDNYVGWSYLKSDGTTGYCSNKIVVQNPCLAITNKPNDLSNLQLADNHCEYTYGEVVEMLRENGMFFPNNSACYEWVFTPNADISATNAVPADADVKLNVGDNNRVAWRYIKPDGTQGFCKYQIKVKYACPPKITTTLTASAEKCDYTLGEVVDMWKADGKTLPGFSSCLGWKYSPKEIKAGNEASFVPATENTKLNAGTNNVGWSYLKADGSIGYCNNVVTINYACPAAAKTPNDIDNLVITDPCDGIAYSEVVGMLRENGVPYPDENDCFKWVYNPNADITSAATALPADGNIRLLQGDNNRVGWSYIKADGTKAYCKYQIKVKYACPTNSKTPNNTDNLVISDPCEGVSYSHVIANLRENGVPYPDENDCFKWVYNPNADITSAATALPADGNIRLLQGDNNRVGWSYIKADGTKAYCKYQIKVKYACPTNSKTPNNTDNLVISDPCEGVSYSHVIANLRENGVPYPDESDCFKWVYNPNADITSAATALPADGNIRLIQGDNNRVGWSYIKADGTKAYCKYQIKVKYACPTNPKSPNNTDKIEVADPCVGIPYADVVELLRGNGVIFPNEGDCLKWAYNPSANISNAATALPVESNLNLLPGLVRLGFSYLKADGNNGYCYLPVTVTYPCPVNPARNDRIFIHYLNDPCSGMNFSDAVNLVRENGMDFPNESSCVKWLYHPTAAIGGSAQIADGSTPIKIGDGNRIGWSYIKADGNPAYCDIQFQAKYTCPTNPKKPINTDNLRLKDNSCSYTVGELVDILRGNGVDVPDQSDCVSWWYRPNGNVDANNKFPAIPETNLTVGDNNYFGWSFVRADGNLQFCAGYRFLIKCQNFDGGIFGANGISSELAAYMSDETKCKVTGNDVIEQLKARRVYLPTIGDNCNVDYSLTYKQNNAVIANPVFDKGTANDFINYTFSLGAPTNYSASCNYKFKVDGSKACPISRLGEMEFSMGVDKEGVKAKLNEQLPIDFTDCGNKSLKLVLDEGSLPADYPVGLVATVKWKVYANTSYQNYTCPQVIKVIDEAPIEINCSDVGVTRRDGDVSVFNMPELNLNGNACSSVDWVIRITDKEYNGNDITAATGAVVEGGKVKADLPLGYSYITYKATCGPRSATCSAKVFVAKDVETCK